jgi:hypothetical protein
MTGARGSKAHGLHDAGGGGDRLTSTFLTIGEPPRRLEAVLHPAAGTVRAGVVVCHPHPQYGGDMENAVVLAVTAALARAGVAALRFNFGGVGRSEGAWDDGRAEQCDVGAAEAALTAHLPVGVPSGVVGYSFGAWVGARAATGLPRVAHVVAIAPPLAFFDWGFVERLRPPLTVVVGDRDQYCSRDALERLAASAPRLRTTVIAGADHFFVGVEDAVARAVVDALGHG